ncbi:MAG: c-type cytochrome, partial [Zetaproteobacteria bacterium]|nr:c-type cytochrome [Zetaproteobacteria bacterium]
PAPQGAAEPGNPNNSKPSRGERLYQEKLCHTCHGVAGQKALSPNWPNLAGQNADYLYEQALYIRDGKRATPMAATMRAMIAQVTDKELRNIAEYLQQVTPLPQDAQGK